MALMVNIGVSLIRHFKAYQAWLVVQPFRRQCLMAGLAGLVAVLSMPPISVWPVLFFSFPTLLWLLDAVPSPRRALLLGWLFGLSFFVGGLYWIANAMLVDVSKFWWLMPFSVLGLPAYLALYPAFSAFVYKKIGETSLHRMGLFAVLWGLGEILRGTIFTGFPWNLIGYSFAGNLSVLQITSVVGAYGLGVLGVILFLWPVALLEEKALSLRQARWSVAPLVLFVGLFGFGFGRLMLSQNQSPTDTYVRIVQGNISQADKYYRHHVYKNFVRYLQLSSLPSAAKIDLLIWPETALPYALDQTDWATEGIAGVLPRGSYAVIGAPKVRYENNRLAQLWNNLFLVDDQGRVVGDYSKSTLVPFGEYVPLADYLPLDKITGGGVGFSKGGGVTTLALPNGKKFSPLICYEVIFPGHVVKVANRPDFLVNITNDAWYGRSSGPYQHLQIARVRAIEEGVPLVRAANTGISAIFDAYGRQVTFLPLNREGVVDSYLPQRLTDTPIYGRMGNRPLILLLLFLSALFCLKKYKKELHP